MAARHRHGQEQCGSVLNAQPFDCVVAVTQPQALRARQDAEIDAPPTGCTAFDLYIRKCTAQSIHQSIGATCLRRIRHGQDTVVIPFDIADVVMGEDVMHPFKEKGLHLSRGHVQHHLLTAHDLSVIAQSPVGMRTENIGIGVDHLWFEPDAERHAQTFDMVDQRCQPLWIFAPINLPVTQRLGVIIAASKPAIIQNKALGAKRCGLCRDLFQIVKTVIKIDGFPAIVMHRARDVRFGKRHNPVAQMALECHRTAIQTIPRKYRI